VRQPSLLAPRLFDPGAPRVTPGISRVSCTKSRPFSASSLFCDSFTVAPTRAIGLRQRSRCLNLNRLGKVAHTRAFFEPDAEERHLLDRAADRLCLR